MTMRPQARTQSPPAIVIVVKIEAATQLDIVSIIALRRSGVNAISTRAAVCGTLEKSSRCSDAYGRTGEDLRPQKS